MYDYTTVLLCFRSDVIIASMNYNKSVKVAIELTNGKVTWVSLCDAPWLTLRRWSTYKGKTNKTCYAMSWQRRSILMHRVILNPPLDMECDHVDGDGLNNTRGNLRLCTKSQNQQNKRKREGCSSQYKGVTWDKSRDKWGAKIFLQGKCYNLGRFNDEREAARTYNEAAKRMFGEFANLNDL